MSDEILNYIKSTVDRIELKQGLQDERIGDLEKWQANANGKMTILSALGVAIGAGLTAAANYFKH